MIQKLNTATGHLAYVINASVCAACNSLDALSQLSVKDKFYWHFISSCCDHVQPRAEDLARLNIYFFAVDKLSKIFQQYCTTRKVNVSVTYKIPQEIIDVSNDDVKHYFEWIAKMHDIIIYWQNKFAEKDFNYDDIITCSNNLRITSDFARAVNANPSVFNDKAIEDLNKRYSEAYVKLYTLLVKDNKKYGW